MTYAVTAARARGEPASVRSWQLASSLDAGDDGSVISLAAYNAGSWLTAPPRSTVMAALLANGEYPDVFYSTNMRDRVDGSRFAVPWWYRALFTLPSGHHAFVRVDGVIPRAELWVNGHRVADASAVAGAYVVSVHDITPVAVPGLNALALRVVPGHPMEDLSIGWVDWSQPPPDHNMGPWRDVIVGCTGSARLGPPHVVTALAGLAGESPAEADLMVTVEVSNVSTRAETVLVAGEVTGHGARLHFAREVALAAGAGEVLRFGGMGRGDVVFEHEHGGSARPGRLSALPGAVPEGAAVPSGAAGARLVLAGPKVWWPAGEGDQPLYRLAVTATVGGVLSDHAEARFGVRTVDSEVRPGGGRQFRVNGRPVQILGAGWSPDLFLRHDHNRLAGQLALTRHLGLNAIRPEGKLENPEFYELCDELGLMVLPGWECCDKWEAWAGTGGDAWDDADLEVAGRSMASEARLLRNHPSVIAFLIGSDFAPPTDVARRYADALESAGWHLPVVSSACAQGSEVTGPSGMKMTGPYSWVPPVYWYERDPNLGGAVGFNSETSAGHTVPRLPSLRRMLSPEELEQLWQQPHLPQYHAAPPSVFDNLSVFGQALSARYGQPRSLEDFVRKAQLAAYEAARAQFEAIVSRAGADEPATGVIYWMLSAPWPSLNWQLFDYYLDTPGSYWGAGKALEGLHVFYAYDRRSVQVVNRTVRSTQPLDVAVRRWRADGPSAGEDHHGVGPLAPRAVVEVAGVETPGDAEGAWFLELELLEGDVPVSRNVYWLSTVEDVLDPGNASWHYMGLSQFADFHALGEMRSAQVSSQARAERAGAELIVTLTVSNDDPSGTPAVGLHPSVTAGDHILAPVLWDDSDVTLFAGQTATLTGRVAPPSGAGPLTVRLEGFNLYRPMVLGPLS